MTSRFFPSPTPRSGGLACAVCYDWLFPEAIRQLAANGAEVLLRVSAYMDPWGSTEPMNWWSLVNRCRALENIAYVVAANQGASARALPAVFAGPAEARSWISTGACSPTRPPDRVNGSSSRRSTSPLSGTSAQTRRGHHMLSHLRTEAYPVYTRHHYPPAGGG